MLRWIIDAQVTIGGLLVDLGTGQAFAKRRMEHIVASLDNLTAAVAKLGADFSKVAADVLAALADLRAQIEALTAGTISQDQIDALTASVTAADDAVAALDAAVPDQPPVE
jgi:outer membrane murein-binding lipoprotein Lpp